MRVLAWFAAHLAVTNAGTDWSEAARWVAPANGLERGGWAVYRHSFDAPDSAESLQLRVAVDTKYWLWLNGEALVFEGGLKRGPTPTGSYFDEVNATRGLLPGARNSLAVLAWYFGNGVPNKDGNAFSHQDSGQHALLVDCVLGTGNGRDETVVSSAEWLAVQHAGYSNDDSGKQPNFRLSENNILFDANAAGGLEGWYLADFNASSWPHATELGRPGDVPWGELLPRPIPQWRDRGFLEYQTVQISTTPNLTDGYREVHGADIDGHDVSGGGAATSGECRAKCDGIAACAAFTWPGCNLKSIGSFHRFATQSSVFVRGITEISAELPYNAHVTPFISLHDAKGGTRVDMMTDDYLTDSGNIPNVRAVYLTKSGSQEHESLGWINGHTVLYRFPADASISNLSVRYRETGYDTDLAGSWQSDDVELNQLWKKAQRTLYVVMRDNWMDCPDRERAQWWFDVAMDIEQAFYALDSRSSLLSRKGILELAAWQRRGTAAEPYAPESLFAPVPGNWTKELPNQSLGSIAFGFLTYFLHTNDVQTILAVYPAVKRYVMSFTMGEDGFVVPRLCPGEENGADVVCPGVWVWCDGQSVNCDYKIIDNSWYYMALKATLQFAAIAEDADVAELQQRMHSIEQHYHAEFWDDSCRCYRSPEHRDRINSTTQCTDKKQNCTNPDDRSNALAVVSGLAPRSVWRDVASLLSPKGQSKYSSTAMERFVLEAMFLANRSEDALERMKDRFGPMIASNLTTMWEHWEYDPTSMRPYESYNHGWSGGGLALLSKYVAGVQPLTPGYGKFEVRPRLGSLKELRCVVPTVRGDIHVGMEVMADASLPRLVMNVTVPETSSATLHVPFAELDGSWHVSIAKNGRPLQRIWPANDAAVAAAWDVRLTEEGLLLEVAAGVFSLEAVGIRSRSAFV